jgi:hypothetical protein
MLTCALSARADDADALSLQSAPEAEQKAPERPVRAFAELAAGRINQRFGLGSAELRRASVDFNASAKPAAGWRLVLSDRLDDLHPVDPGSRATLNSLREAFASWQDDAGQGVVEFGRINLRNGPAYGYNPTDFLRDGAVRAVTTADPLSLRENRMGTVMLRAQRMWAGGSASIALMPKLANAPSNDGGSLDLGATNGRAKLLASISLQPTERLSGQILAFAQRGIGAQWGANMTALLSDSTVAFAEWTTGRDLSVLTPALGGSSASATRNRASAGLTYTSPWKLSVTAEFEYNGFAVDPRRWSQWGALGGTDAAQSYLVDAQRRQDNASRKAYLLYVTQHGGPWKNVDITGLLRFNGDDHSRFGWIEVRHHWTSVDLAVQWQISSGRAFSEYGVVPARQALQLMAAYFF